MREEGGGCICGTLRYMYICLQSYVLLLLSAQKGNFFSTDESPLPATITAGYNWTQLISMIVLVFLVAVVGIGIWWLLDSVGKPDLVISSDTYQ